MWVSVQLAYVKDLEQFADRAKKLSKAGGKEPSEDSPAATESRAARRAAAKAKANLQKEQADLYAKQQRIAESERKKAEGQATNAEKEKTAKANSMKPRSAAEGGTADSSGAGTKVT